MEQNGHYSEKIELSRGCRQGDPISPYLFVICAKVLSHVLRECNDVKGIDIEGVEVKLSQYADDTTLYLQGDKGSLCAVMGILGWFKKLSGLGVNPGGGGGGGGGHSGTEGGRTLVTYFAEEGVIY